ncbi:MAG: Exporter-like protein [Chthoniobacteraceae bacterium]|nr:Exporter-like protein [Chthoniobacteraceae bacterium]
MQSNQDAPPAVPAATLPPQKSHGARLRKWLLILLLVAFTAAGLSRISFNIEILKLLPDNLKQVTGLSLFLKHFSLPNELIVTLEAPDSDTAEAAADALAEHFRTRPDLFKHAVSRPPWEKKPAELSELLAFLAINQPPEKIKELLTRTTPENAPETLKSSLEKLGDSLSPQEIALLSYDPYGFSQALAQNGLVEGQMQSEFASADGAFRVIYLEAATPRFKNYKDTLAWLNQAKKIARAWNTNPNLTIGFTGEPAFVADISSSMEWDMSSSGFSTLFVVGAIFWVCYRRAKPLFELWSMLILVFFLSLAAAGLLLNQLTVIGVGFASIMIGLSVDYGYLIYQKSLHHTGTVRELQRICFQNIVWTAGTTAAAFFALNLSSLPGLSQLGNLVGIGVVVGAIVMLTLFVPIAMRIKKVERPPSFIESLLESPRVIQAGTWLTLATVIGLGAVLLLKGAPALDFSSRSLRPRHSDAYTALDQLQRRLIDERDLASLIVQGSSVDEVRDRMEKAESQLASAKARGEVDSYRSTLPLWAAPANQRANLPLLAKLATEAPRLKQAMMAAGFTEESFTLTGAVLDQFAAWAGKATPVWPENETSKWIFRRTIRYQDGNFLALGIVQPAAGHDQAVSNQLAAPGVHLASWNLLGKELQEVIPREFMHVFLGLIGIVFFILIVGFRGLRDVLLLAIAMILVFISLAGAMRLLGMEWNFFNLSAILLLLGTGIDYSILLILALRANNGDIPDAQRQLGLVIILCAAAATAGFGSISWANNLGLASLGKTCALGLLLDAMISVFLLPQAWKFIHRRR